MAASKNHIVNKVIYHVNGVPVNRAFSIKEEAAAYIKTGFSNKIQAIFDKYFPETDNTYIDKLQLDLTLLPGEINLSSYEKQLLDLLERQLQKKANAIQPAKKIKEEACREQKQSELIEKAKKENYTPADAFVFFLENGYLPWWCKIVRQEVFEEQLIAHFTAVNKEAIKLIAKRIINAGQKVIYRFIHQFSDDFKYKLAAVFLREHSAIIKKLHKELLETVAKKFTVLLRTQRNILDGKTQTYTGQPIENVTAFLFWNACWPVLETGHSFQQFETAVKNTIKKIQASTNEPPANKASENKTGANKPVTDRRTENIPALKNTLLQKLIDESKEQQWHPDKNDANHVENKEIDAADQIFINNAGLVLLHPFLTTLFNALLVVKDDEIIDRAKAIACLNYLCGYEEMQPEYEWPLMKILCGMEIFETVEHLFVLSDADKLECNALLQQVIDYWIALKQTSAEGLQQTFIQRFGKLASNENGWLLLVEQKIVDILKDRLPWGVSMVKLPWMKQLLTVEW